MSNLPHKIIFLNGPPSCGKDTIANVLYERGARHMKFSATLKETAKALFNISNEQYRELERPGSQDLKDTKLPMLLNHSWREVLIWLSEDAVKPIFGARFFGIQALNRMQDKNGNLAFTSCAATVFSDCGFVEEVLPIVNFFGAQNCQLWTVKRHGCTFKDDSRTYIENFIPAAVSRLTFNNDYDMLMLVTRATTYYEKFMFNKPGSTL